MQVSRYSAPRSRASWISAMLETSTDRLSRKSPAPEQRLEHAAVVLARERAFDELDAELLAPRCRPRILGGDDGDAVRRNADVTQDQRQDPLADAAEADKNDPARKIHMHFVFAHESFTVLADRPPLPGQSTCRTLVGRTRSQTYPCGRGDAQTGRLAPMRRDRSARSRAAISMRRIQRASAG